MEEMIESTVNAEPEVPVVGEQVAEEGGAAEQPAAEQQEPAEPARQTREQNAAFAAARRQAEAEAKAAREQTERLMGALKAFGYNAETPEQAVDLLEAQRRGVPVDQIVAERTAHEQRLREAMENSPEMQALREERDNLSRWKMERDFADDLAKIKAHNPKETAKSVTDLGRDFMAARAMGVDTVTAYELVQAKKNRETPPLPPELPQLGDANDVPKDFFTPEEVRAMSPEEVHKNFDKIRASQKDW